ncbi:small nuclear ribonucleoprotein Sm D3 [Aspergillus udagawae]|nr:small nuclear ribonucleoprotein Sm D3 [Aspergillus udagawae]
MTSAPHPISASQNQTTTTAPQIRNPRRLLILSPSSHSASTIPSLLHSLTETPVADPPASFAGYTTHPPLRLTNRYYTADIPIWVDEIPLPAAADDHAHTLAHTEAETQTQNQTGREGERAPAPAPSPSPAQWAVEFSGADAQVVRDAIGALVICIRNLEDTSASLPAGSGTDADAGTPESRADVKSLLEFLSAVGRVKGVIEEERGEVGDVPVLLVLVGEGHKDGRVRAEDGDLDELDASDDPFSVGWWEDQLFEMGMVGVEVLEWDPKGKEGEQRNVYGEYQGMRRIREILETHDWAAPSEDADPGGFSDDDLEEHLLGLDRGENGFDLEVNELEREMLGLRMAIEHGGDDGDDQDEDEEIDDGLKVESLEALMMRMQAIRDMSSELPESERKKFAAKAVRDIMKEL